MDLITKMEVLLDAFAAGDTSGMAKRLFDKFTLKQSRVTFFEDAALNKASSTRTCTRPTTSATAAATVSA